MTIDDKRWRAESDAHTLAKSIVIQKDPIRMKAATEAAERMAKEKREDANAMGNVAKRKAGGSGSTVSKQKVKPAPKEGDIKKEDVKGAVKFNVFQKI